MKLFYRRREGGVIRTGISYSFEHGPVITAAIVRPRWRIMVGLRYSTRAHRFFLRRHFIRTVCTARKHNYDIERDMCYCGQFDGHEMRMTTTTYAIVNQPPGAR